MTLRKIEKSPIPMNPIILAAWEMLLKTNKKLFKKKGNKYLRDKWDNYSLSGTLCELHSYVSGEDWELSKLSGAMYWYMDQSYIIPPDVARWAFEHSGRKLSYTELEGLQDFMTSFSKLFEPNLRWPTNKELYQAFGGDYEKLKRKRYVKTSDKE